MEVYAAGSLLEADAICDLLNEAGIEALVVGENLQIALGEIPVSQAAPRVWAAAEDAFRARAVIDEWQKDRQGRYEQALREVQQFSLRKLFLCTTICAVLAAIFSAARGSPWVGVIVGGAAYMLVVGLLIATYLRRKRELAALNDDDDDQPEYDPHLDTKWKTC